MFGAVLGFGILSISQRPAAAGHRQGQPVAPEDVERLTHWLKVMSVVMGLSMVGVATWIAHFCWRISTTQVYPPPGSRDIKPKRVLRGTSARMFALVGYFVAATLGVTGLALIPVVWRLLAKLGAHA